MIKEKHVIIELKRAADGRLYTDGEKFPRDTDVDVLRVQVDVDEDGCQEPEDRRVSRIYPVFRQAGEIYDEWSDYVCHHGCAVCSATSVLAAWVNGLGDIMPQNVINTIEPEVLTQSEWDKNYGKSPQERMPVSMHGIGCMLEYYGIQWEHISKVRGASAAAKIRNHLCKGLPVIVETSRIRYKWGIPVSINDRKYAGSYHTMVILAIEKDMQTVWVTDSAHRLWARESQRLKRVKLADLMNYMFNCHAPDDESPYFKGRLSTGGFILVSNKERMYD